MAKETEGKPGVGIQKRIETTFENNLYSLQLSMTNLYPVVTSHDNVAKKDLENLKDAMGRLIISFHPDTTNKSREMDMSTSKERVSSTVEDILKLVKEDDFAGINLRFYDGRLSLLLKSSFMMLISCLDFLLSDLLHCYYDKYPKALNDEMTLSVGELKKCTDLNEALHMLIDRKVESLLFKNFANQILFFKNDLKIDIEDDIIKWETINEAYQRRNLVAHNDGIVNGRYISNVMTLPGARKIKEGDRLEVSAEYFMQVYREILIGGIILTQNCWRKWFKNDLESADSTLIASINKGLALRELEVAEKLAVFSKGIKVFDEENRDTLVLLYCHTLKKLGKENEFKKEMSKLEKDSLSQRCLVSLAVLKDDRKAFYENVRKAAKMDKIYRWEFKGAIGQIYGEFSGDEDFETKLDEAFR